MNSPNDGSNPDVEMNAESKPLVLSVDSSRTDLRTNDLLDPELSDGVADDLAYSMAAVGYYRDRFENGPPPVTAEIVAASVDEAPLSSTANSRIEVEFRPPIGPTFRKTFVPPTPDSTPEDSDFVRLMCMTGTNFDQIGNMVGETVPLMYDSDQD